MIRVSEIEYFPKDVREDFEKFDEVITLLKNVYGDLKALKTLTRMFELREYD